MKYSLLTFLTLSALISVVPETSASELVVNVENLHTGKGKLYTSLCSSAHFMNGRCDYEIIKKVDKDTEQVVFSQISPGSYAVSVFYDVNNNSELDTSIFGIPKEPTGVSNNVVGKIGPPAFSDAQINIDEHDKEITIKVF
ncbi:DUF2141 domain-containing protein [Thalassotalea fusca]